MDICYRKSWCSSILSIKYSVSSSEKKTFVIRKEILKVTVKLINRGKVTTAKAIDISDKGELVIENHQGILEYVVSGEVSIRGIYGYSK